MIKEALLKFHQRVPLKQTPDYQIFKKEHFYLTAHPWLDELYDDLTMEGLLFDTMLIRMIKNKVLIENAYRLAMEELQDHSLSAPQQRKYLRDKLNELYDSLPYLVVNEQRIYVPFFDTITNLAYYDHIERLGEPTYAVLNKRFKDAFLSPFELYGEMLFTSQFTTLQPLHADAFSRAYYHPSFQTVFIITQQGTIDFIIPLFDKGIETKDFHQFEARMEIVLRAYFNHDKTRFVQMLFENNFISKKLFRYINARLR